MADRQQFTDTQLNTIRESDEFKKFQESKENATIEDYLASDEAYNFWSDKLGMKEEDKRSPEEKIEDAFAKMSAEFEYDEKGTVEEFIATRDEVLKSASAEETRAVNAKISSLLEKDMVPYGGDVVAVPDKMKNMYDDMSKAQEESVNKAFTPHEYEGQELDDATHDAIREYQMRMDGRISEDEDKGKAQKGITIDQLTTEDANEKMATAVMNDTETVWGGDDDDISDDEKKTLEVTGVTKEQYKGMTPQERSDLHQEAARIRSADSDQNAMKFNMQIVNTLHDMKEISDEDLNKAQGSVMEAALLASKADELDDKKRMEFDIRFADKLTKNPELLEVTPPSILATSHDALKKFVESAKKRNPDADLSAQEAQLESINKRIDVLTDSLAKDEGLYFADVTNIADTYQGYMDMMAAREKDLEENDPRRTTIESNRTKLNGMISEYDDMWNLPDGMSAEEAEKRFDEAYKLVPDLQLSPETLALVSQYQFVDKQHKETVDQKRLDKANSDLDQYLGAMYVETHPDTNIDDKYHTTPEYQAWEAEYLKNTEDKNLQALLAEKEAAQKPVVEDVMAPIPQFIDPKDGSKHVEYKEGFVVDPEGKLATVIKLTANDEVMKSLGSKEPITKEGLEQGLNENLKYKLFAIHNSEETIQGVAEAPDKFTNPQYAAEFVQKLEYQQEFADRKANGETQEQILAGIDNEIKQHLGGMDLDQYLGAMYVETHPDTNIDDKYHTTPEYQAWEADFLKNTDDKKLRGLLVKKEAAQKPMQISPAGYEAAIDHQVDTVDAFAHRLAQKTGDPKAPVIGKLYDKVADIDKLAGARMDGKPSKAEIRKKLAKQIGTKALSSFGMATAFTMATRAIGASYGTTAATITGAAVGIGTTAWMIYKRKKQAKKLGQKYGWKEFKKDHAAHVAIATSACAGAAAAFSMTGNPELAATFGTAAIVIGSGGSALEGYKQAREGGLGKGESLLWAVGMAGATYGGAQMGRMAGNAAVDAINNAWQDNTIFQNRAEITTQQTETKTEVAYKEGVVDGAKNILNQWYADNPELLQQRVDSINAYNAEHGTNIDPYRYLLTAHDAGAIAPTDTIHHVQGGADVHSHGNHKVFGDGWTAQTGVSTESVNSLAGSIGPDGVNLTPESIGAFQQIDGYVSASNQVGYVPDTPYQDDGVLSFNASQTADGNLVADPNGDRYTTYADHGSIYDVKTTETTLTHTDVQYTDKPGVTAIWGGVGFMSKVSKGISKRFGALKDKITGKKPTEKPVENTGTVPGGKGTDKIIGAPGKEKNPTPPHDNGGKKGLDVGGIVAPVPGKDKEKGPTPENPNLSALQGDNVFYEDTSGDVAYNEVEGLNKEEDKKKAATVEGHGNFDIHGRVIRNAPAPQAKEEKAPATQEKPVAEKTAEEKPKKKSLFGRLFGGSKTTENKSPAASLATPTGMIPVLTQDTTGKTETAFREAAKTTENETVKKSKWRSFSFSKALGGLKDRVGQWQEKRAAQKEQARKDKERIERRKNFDYGQAEFGEFTMNALGNEDPNLRANSEAPATQQGAEQTKTGSVKERKAEVEARKAEPKQLTNEELMAAMSGNTGGAYDANKGENSAKAPVSNAGKQTTLEERLMMMHNQDYTK